MGGGAPGAAAHDRSQDRRSGRPSVRLPRPPGGQHVYQQGGHPDALPQGRSLAQRRPRPHHQPPRPRDYRQPALQRQGADDPVRAAGLARTPLARDDAALRPDHAEHADQGLHRCRLLRPQRAHNRGADRPRGGAERRGGCGRALAALRPWPRLLQLHVLRAVPPPDGLRTLPLLHSQAKRQGAAARSQSGRGPQAGADPAHRRRARRRRAGSAGRGQAARRPGEHADPGRPNAPRTCGAPVTFALSAIFHITLDWLERVSLRRQTTAELNKEESRNALARAVCFHASVVCATARPNLQQHRASGLTLVTAAIVLWNTRYLERAVAALRQAEDVPDQLLTHLSPLGWEHVNLTGDYVWAAEQSLSENSDGLRPLRAFTDPSLRAA